MIQLNKHIVLLFKRFIFILLLFSLTRFIFWFFNFNYFSPLSYAGTLSAFFHGITFDISAICYFNVIFFILHLFPGNFKDNKKYQLFLKILFVVVNGIILSSNLIDTKYFQFTNKRSTFDIFYMIGMGNDVLVLLPKFITDYWYLVVIWIGIVAILWFFYPELKKIQKIKYSIFDYVYHVIAFLIIGTVIFFGGRGSLELKPLRIISAANYVNASYIPLVLNTPFSILRTSGGKSLQAKQYFTTDELRKIYSPLRNYADTLEFRNDNVVIIILESFSSEYFGFYNKGKGYTPFLDSLMNHSLVFMHNFANGKKSIEGIPAVIASLPTLMNNPYISSGFSSDRINSIASILKEKGYNSSFFHGGSNGTMGFDKFAKLAEVDKYYGRSEYNNERDYDGHWGIWDEEFLQYFAKMLNSFKQPFVSSVFTLSSHHPFPIPERYKNRFNKGKYPLENSIEYSDYALQQFFATISQTEWYKHTLFVFTADHTAGEIDENHTLNADSYSTPLIFYHPSDSTLIGKRYDISQQMDIMPSVLDYLHYNKNFIAFGNSVFDKNRKPFAIYYINEVYQYIYKDYTLKFDGENPIGLFNTFTDTLLQNNIANKDTIETKDTENRLKAFIQSYNNRLINNNLTVH